MKIFEIINILESLTKDELLKNIEKKRQQMFVDQMLGALHKLIQNKGNLQGVGSYAYDIARSYGVNPRDLVKMYKEKYGVIENEQADEITQEMLNKLEYYLDQIFSKVGIDIEFTRHFLDRVNDSRNKRPITLKELAILFKDTYIKYGKRIAKMGPDAEAVIRDMRSDVNVPFVLNWDNKNLELDLVAKTVMRKKDFRTPDTELPLQ
jgi:hypothetical protein